MGDWTPQDLADKADSEGGIYELILWGGPGIFDGLGPAAVTLAALAESALEALKSLLPEPGQGEY